MNVTALVFLIISATAVMALPRKWAPVPLLASCCYMTIGQGIELGPVSLPVYRIVLAVGLLRVIVKRETMVGGINTIDKLVIAWAGWMVFASFFHEWMPGSGPVYASGFVFNVTLVYFLTRVWCRDLSELMAVSRIVAWLLVPVALAMLAEHTLERNVFGMFGGVPEGVYVRDGAIRAQGPFQHPILAGTVGAVCLPIMIGIWRRYRISATIGLAACVAIVLASTSSGPLMSLFMGVSALLMWFYRRWLRVVWWAAIGTYMAAEILMTRPAYYLISKIDLTGSSTGWHRSRLIESAFEHLSEWWAFGTDYTGHWMATTVGETSQHADFTNYYIWIGVIGGLPAMLLFIAIIWRAFICVGRSIRKVACCAPGAPVHDLVSGGWALRSRGHEFVGVVPRSVDDVFLAKHRRNQLHVFGRGHGRGRREARVGGCHSRCQAAGDARWGPTPAVAETAAGKRWPSPSRTCVISLGASHCAPSSRQTPHQPLGRMRRLGLGRDQAPVRRAAGNRVRGALLPRHPGSGEAAVRLANG